MPESLDDLAHSLGRDVSRETRAALERYLVLLKKWNPAINLVSAKTLAEGWSRHIVDSAQVFAAAERHEGSWLDFGSGGGFPGMVCAILARELAPDIRFTLVESDKRKCAFLSSVARDLGLTVQIEAKRIEQFEAQSASIISARAVADLGALLGYALPHLSKDGICLFPKGESHEQEIRDASRSWRFKLSKRPSITDNKAVILVLGDIQRV